METNKLLQSHHDAVAALRPSIQDLSPTAAQRILARFGAAMEANFVAWLASAAVFAKSEEGRTAARTNLRDENSENHPDMLRTFLESLGAIPVWHYDEVSTAVSEVRRLIAPCSGLEEMALMSLLESTSDIIMPLIRSLGERIATVQEITFDTKYCDVHDSADGEHTRIFLEGLNAEIPFHEEVDARIQRTEEVVRGFWTAILTTAS